jgi:hypothetical protein
VRDVGDTVGYLEGAYKVGKADPEAAVGFRVGAAVGLLSQLLIPCLKAHRALASFRCLSVG